jgi:hypothetical protein
MNVNEFIVYHQGLTKSGEVGEVFDLSTLELSSDIPEMFL